MERRLVGPMITASTSYELAGVTYSLESDESLALMSLLNTQEDRSCVLCSVLGRDFNFFFTSSGVMCFFKEFRCKPIFSVDV